MSEPSYSSQLWFKNAVAFAQGIHDGQVDRAGEPRIDHLLRTAGHLVRLFPDATAAEVQAAILHDAIEHGSATPADLAAAGVMPLALFILLELRRPPEISDYATWIQWLTHNAGDGALRVKLAEVTDNRAPDRCRRAKMRMEMTNRYEPAAAVLHGALKWRGGEGERQMQARNERS